MDSEQEKKDMALGAMLRKMPLGYDLSRFKNLDGSVVWAFSEWDDPDGGIVCDSPEAALAEIETGERENPIRREVILAGRMASDLVLALQEIADIADDANGKWQAAVDAAQK